MCMFSGWTWGKPWRTRQKQSLARAILDVIDEDKIVDADDVDDTPPDVCDQSHVDLLEQGR